MPRCGHYSPSAVPAPAPSSLRRRAAHGLLVAALVALAAALAGCGKTTAVRESSLTVSGDQTPPPGAGRLPAPDGRGADSVRIAVITHGQASSPFWAIVRNGVEAAARQMDVLVTYRAPDVYSLDRMKQMVQQA